MLESFAPLVDENTRILVIGTMPGEASLAAREYYAFKHNAFWPIIEQIYGQPLAHYAQKQNALKNLGIGLWDNLRFCTREGSLDSRIKNEEPNDFETLLRQYPQIQKLLFNGQKSFAFFKKYHPALLAAYTYEVMLSTSPANARLTLVEKERIWRAALL